MEMAVAEVLAPVDWEVVTCYYRVGQAYGGAVVVTARWSLRSVSV